MTNKELSKKGVEKAIAVVSKDHTGDIWFDRDVHYLSDIEQPDGSFKKETRKFITAGSYVSLNLVKDALAYEKEFPELNITSRERVNEENQKQLSITGLTKN